MKKLLGWVALIAVVLWISQNPATAAADLHHFMHAAQTFISGL